MNGLTVDFVIEKRILLRDKRAELKKRFEEEDGKLKALEEQCEVWLLKRAQEMGVDQFKVAGVGTAFRGTETHVNCTDWQILHGWVRETGNLDIFERRVSRKFVQEYQKAHDGAVPPALNIVTEQVINVRRASAVSSKGEAQ